ncbi:MAG TPA: hypothetical protein VMA95_00940 [Streptosporangiaceae bacterium]|nr:hypothetical protein [Streptosporangiaceae bacterium]
MSQLRRSGKRLWWMSAGAVVVIVGVLTGTMLANAAGPSLPARTPAQLLADMQRAKPPAAFSGVVSETANLGFPSLPNIAGLSSSTLSAANWISGTHTVDIWYAGPRHLRLAVPVSFGETDLRVNGNEVWLWDSHSQTATHYIVSAGPAASRQVPFPMRPGLVRHCVAPIRKLKAGAKGKQRAVPVSVREKALKCLRAQVRARAELPARRVPFLPVTPLTPQQIANRLLANVGPTTSVTVPGTTSVAGRPAYQLVITPRTDQSLIGHIEIDVDSATYLPLQVQVFARGAASPAFKVGFTSLSFSKPAASNFTFSPPAGAHVKTVKPSKAAALPGTIGPPRLRVNHPLTMKNGHGVHVAFVPTIPSSGVATPASPKVLGKGWLSVVVLGNTAGPVPAQDMAILQVLLNAAKPVHGSWGSGKLLRTTLLNALITSKGKVLIGAVTPAVLYADAAKAK